MWQIVLSIYGQVKFFNPMQCYYMVTLTFLLARGGISVLLRLVCDHGGGDTM